MVAVTLLNNKNVAKLAFGLCLCHKVSYTLQVPCHTKQPAKASVHAGGVSKMPKTDDPDPDIDA